MVAAGFVASVLPPKNATPAAFAATIAPPVAPENSVDPTDAVDSVAFVIPAKTVRQLDSVSIPPHANPIAPVNYVVLMVAEERVERALRV